MKNYSKISVFLLIICVIGADGDEMKRVSVMEGDSVTLDIDFREEFNHVMWIFGNSGSIIAETDGYEPSYTDDERFRDRLKLNHQTGSLTINNMRVTDSGIYHLEINQNYRDLLKIFSVTVYVFGADEDEVKRESVMEGESVTLDTRLREKFNQIKWRFGDSIIAETDSNEISYTDNERFRDRLKMNNQTGSLTINNMRITDTGVYELRLDYNTGTSNQIFNVTVYGSFYSFLSHGPVAAIVVVILLVLAGVIYWCKICKRRRQNLFGADEDEVKRESVMEGDSVTLDTDLREKFKRMQWWFGDSIIAETDGNKISYTDNERFRDRLKMNHLTGSLTINNMRITDSGLYHLEINGTSNKTFVVTVYVIGDEEEEFNRKLWMFGDSNSFIAEIDRYEPSYTNDERFRDRLNLNHLTGSLYHPWIDHSAGTSNQKYKDTVYDEEKTESAKEGESVALKTDTEKLTDDEMVKSWSWSWNHKAGSPKTPDSGYSGL